MVPVTRWTEATMEFLPLIITLAVAHLAFGLLVVLGR
jgi:hypothetical protein